MCYRDSRPRIRKEEGGFSSFIIIRRLRCSDCGRYHNELPDCIAPYKHYCTDTISGVIDNVVTPDDLDSEDYPCYETMQRWLLWFSGNLERIEGYLRNAGCRILDNCNDFLLSGASLLSSIREVHSNWLDIILRIIYNSGGFLVPIQW